MQRSESVEIGANASRVWEVAAKEFEHIDRWASMVERSEAVREPAFLAESPGCSGRVCVTPQGETREVLVAYDDAARTFTYEITGGGMPGFVKRATNTWTVEALGPDRSLLTMTVEMTTGGVMGALM
ncbi:MAG: SRPBCC family protein, partial [Myxococcota bacterium]